MAEYSAGGIPIPVISKTDTLKQIEQQDNIKIEEEKPYEVKYESLAGHIVSKFEINKRARVDSGIEDEILDSKRAYNGEYSQKDKARIAQSGGSDIFLNITSTKARAARSWLADVFDPPKLKPWSLKPTPMEDLPSGIKEMLQTRIQQEFDQMSKSEQPPTAEEAGEKIRDLNRKKRDIQKVIAEEITAEAQFQLDQMEKKIHDQLTEGNWKGAFLNFLDDFVIYPSAIMKGPIVINSNKLVWKDGKPSIKKGYKYLNCRIDPLDVYPSPNAETIDDGDFCEHVRFTKATIAKLRGVKNYKDDAIAKVLEDAATGIMGSWVDTGIEQDKAEGEKKANSVHIENEIIHGIHYWGYITLKQLESWEFYEKLEDIEETDPNAVLHVEAILVGNHVIKCVVVDDPLNRRPYYKASYMNIPGSFWGRSLPLLMDSQQRMCNAVARALSNNLGIASGFQVEIYTDRLADDGPIDQIEPFKIWQVKQDPTGAGGRAVTFWQPKSNANELLGVYKSFEERADDVTGVPRYLYSNERTAGATQTAQGLAMLLESASKIIKDCIRNIDEGVLKPRVLYQFYHNMMNLEDMRYTGDINVVTLGSKTLTIKGAEATRRNEFLQATANPTDMQVMGVEGRTEILREMASDLGFPTNVIPSSFEIKARMKKDAEQQQKIAEMQAKTEQDKIEAGIKATTVQIEGQKSMHSDAMLLKFEEFKKKTEKDNNELQLKIAALQAKVMSDRRKSDSIDKAEENKTTRQNQEIALKITKGEGI